MDYLVVFEAYFQVFNLNFEASFPFLFLSMNNDWLID